MKSLIVYYSYSGNTKLVAHLLREALKEKGEVELLELKPIDESSSFLKQCRRAFKHQRAKLPETNYDLSGYDLVCFGSPVWAFAPAPSLNTYLANCQAIAGKETIIFTTYGSGTGNKRCLNYMQDLLNQKGVKVIKRFTVQGSKVKDRAFVVSKIKEIL